MTCVVFGASGLIGRCLLPSLAVATGDGEVVAISRHARTGAGVRWVAGRLPDRVRGLPRRVDTVICLGPLDHFSAWFAAARLRGVSTVVAMSSMSAESKHASPVAAERDLSRRLRAGERRLQAACEAAGCRCVILRATLIYGGPEGGLERLATRARRWHVFPVPRGRGLRQPVHAADLARAVLAALERREAAGVIEAGGGERLGVGEMFARAGRALAPRLPRVPLPGVLLRASARLWRRDVGIADRLDENLVADNGKLVGLLGVRPRRFLPGGGDRGVS